MLVTDGNYKQSLAIVRSLSRAGMTVDVIGSYRCYSAQSRHCNTSWEVPLSEPERTTRLFEIIREQKYDVFIPVGGSSVKWAATHQETLRQHTKLVLSTFDQVVLALDKQKTQAVAESLGIRVPRSLTWRPGEPFDGVLDKCTFPVVSKGADELTTWDVMKHEDPGSLSHRLLSLQLGDNDEESFLVQEFVTGEGVGYFALCHDGHVLNDFMHRRIREYPATGGSSACAESIESEDLRSKGRSILSALQWTGVAMVEFIRDSRGELVFLEINPKFWGSLDLAIASGVNFPLLLVNQAMRKDLNQTDDYEVGKRFHWPLEGELQHVASRPGSVGSVIKDFLSPTTSNNIDIRDLRPTTSRVWLGVRQALGLSFRKVATSARPIKVVVYRLNKFGLVATLSRFVGETLGIPVLRHGQFSNGLIVGAQQKRLGKRKLERHEVAGTLNLRAEFDDASQGFCVGEYKHVPIVEYDPPTVDQLIESVDFITRVKTHGPVYIHCREGLSRAATVVVAQLMSEGFTLDAALEELRIVRPFANILPNQLESLRAYGLVISRTV